VLASLMGSPAFDAFPAAVSLDLVAWCHSLPDSLSAGYNCNILTALLYSEFAVVKTGQ